MLISSKLSSSSSKLSSVAFAGSATSNDETGGGVSAFRFIPSEAEESRSEKYKE
jgi:hypothetical protein